jgi:uncharacterized membrane protein
VTRSERDQIARAIREAEDGTSGRIAVRIVPDPAVDAFERAKLELGHAALHRNSDASALVLVAPQARVFAVIGDRALHERVGPQFWQDIVAEAQPYFARGALTEGILQAIMRLGAALKTHFTPPSTPAP